MAQDIVSTEAHEATRSLSNFRCYNITPFCNRR